MEKKQPFWRRVWFLLLLSLVALLALVYLFRGTLMSQSWLWAFQIRSYEKADAKQSPKKGQILFVGSSSIRYWKSLQKDMTPLPLLNRGFGGAHVPHVTHYADRILFPYQPKSIVLYVGENDLAAGKRPQRVMADLDALLGLIHKRLPTTQLFFVSVKPSVLREETWPVMKAFNANVKAKLKALPWARYIDVTGGMLTKEGKAKPSLFSWDRLHMSPEGYRIWTAAIKPVVQKAWNQLQNKPTARR